MLQRILCALVLLAGSALLAEDIVTKDGTIYKNVSISSVTPVGFDICYSPKKGSLSIKELRFTDLPEKYQKKYNYDPQRAAAFDQKVKEYQAQKADDLLKAYRERMAAAQESDHVQAAIYAQRMNIIFNPIKPVMGATIGYIDALETTPTSGHYGKALLVGIELPQNGDWAGTIYPTGRFTNTDQGNLPVYTTSVDQAVVMVLHHFTYNNEKLQ